MKIIITVLVLMVVYRQRHHIEKIIKCVICAYAAVCDAWKNIK